MRHFLIFFLFSVFSTSLVKSQNIGFSASTGCEQNPIALADTTNGPSVVSWAWDFDNDSIFDDGFGKTIYKTFGTHGTVSVGLKITYNSGSTDSVYQNIEVAPMPQVNFNVDNLCVGEAAVFEENSTIATGTIDQYIWSFDGEPGTITTKVASYNHGVAGTYVAKLTCVSDFGCESSTSKQNEVFQRPIAWFTTPAENLLGDVIQFTNVSTIDTGSSISYYWWDFGDGFTAAQENPAHEFNEVGAYTVKLYIISDKDCKSDTASGSVTILPTDYLEGAQVTQLVTPNGDGVNDFILIENVDLSATCSISIYNRWNDLVYSHSNYNNDFTGESLDAGAYYYIIVCDGKEKMGTLNILK